jgi:hypothetical protein
MLGMIARWGHNVLLVSAGWLVVAVLSLAR